MDAGVRVSLEVGFSEGILPEAFANLRGQQTRAIGNMSEFPYENAQFDVVLMDGAAVSLASVKEAHRVLKPEGRLFFTVPEKTKAQDGFTLPDIYSIVRGGFNITEVSRPSWWFFGRRGRTLTICAKKKNWKTLTNTFRPYVGLAACLLLFPCSLSAMTSAEAVAVILNSKNSTSKRNYEMAREIVMRDAESGKPLQQFVIGVTTDDNALAKRYLDASRDRIRALAEKKDNPMAWYLLSMENNDLRMLQRAANGGNVQALNALGAIATQEALARTTVSSNDLERILRKSYDFFHKAALQRDANGFINLGTCYLRGFGCKQDMTMAFDCFRTAAELGHPEGMDNVSACYQFGHGVAKNSELCLWWAMRGRAARGDEAAAKWLKERK